MELRNGEILRIDSFDSGDTLRPTDTYCVGCLARLNADDGWFVTFDRPYPNYNSKHVGLQEERRTCNVAWHRSSRMIPKSRLIVVSSIELLLILPSIYFLFIAWHLRQFTSDQWDTFHLRYFSKLYLIVLYEIRGWKNKKKHRERQKKRGCRLLSMTTCLVVVKTRKRKILLLNQ